MIWREKKKTLQKIKKSFVSFDLIMASWLSSSSSSGFSWRNLVCVCFVVIVLSNILSGGLCSAARPMREKKDSEMTMSPLEVLKIYQEKMQRNRGMVFNVLPKGIPIPPSGPSKRHNSQGNWSSNSTYTVILTFSDEIYILVFLFESIEAKIS